MHPTQLELEATLDTIRMSPRDVGVLEMIVRRPESEAREVLDLGQLDVTAGLVGDTWYSSSRGEPADPVVQLTLMNSRAIAAVAGPRDRWPLAGDQLYVDFDLSLDNLPPGTQLEIGSALVEVTAEPHTGCHKFRARFGGDALRFVNSSTGRQLNLRGINTRIIQAGQIRVGDPIRKVS